MIIFVPANDDRYMRMVQHTVTNTAHQCPPKFALTTTANDDGSSSNFVSVIHYLMPGLVPMGENELDILDPMCFTSSHIQYSQFLSFLSQHFRHLMHLGRGHDPAEVPQVLRDVDDVELVVGLVDVASVPIESKLAVFAGVHC